MKVPQEEYKMTIYHIVLELLHQRGMSEGAARSTNADEESKRIIRGSFNGHNQRIRM